MIIRGARSLRYGYDTIVWSSHTLHVDAIREYVSVMVRVYTRLLVITAPLAIDTHHRYGVIGQVVITTRMAMSRTSPLRSVTRHRLLRQLPIGIVTSNTTPLIAIEEEDAIALVNGEMMSKRQLVGATMLRRAVIITTSKEVLDDGTSAPQYTSHY